MEDNTGGSESADESLPNFTVMTTSLSSPSDPTSIEHSLPPLQTPFAQIKQDISECSRALNSFLGANFIEAESILAPLASSQRSIYGSLGMGLLFALKSLFTFDVEDIKKSSDNLANAIKIANSTKKGMTTSTIYSRLARILSSRRKSSTDLKKKLNISKNASTMSEDEIDAVLRHVDLVTAESYLLKAVLLLITDSSGGWMLLVRESLNIRTSYWIYRMAFNKLATAKSTDETDVHYESGILLGNGLLHLMFSLIPPKVFQVFSFLGYSGNISIGLSQLKAAVACHSGSRSPVAELCILLYYTVLAGSMSIRRGADSSDESPDNWVTLVKEILDKRLAMHPSSPIFIYFQARYLVLCKNIPQASVFLEQALTLKGSSQWPQLLNACVWELLTTNMYQLQWGRCYELSQMLTNESKWSICFSVFLEAIFLTASKYSIDPQPEIREKIFKLFSMVPAYQKRIAGRSLPIEKYAVHRAKEAIASGELPFHPEYELLLVWDGFTFMNDDALNHVLQTLKDEEHTGLHDFQKGMILLINASILRVKHEYQEAISLIEEALKLAKQLPRDSYLFPVAHTEWSQISLLQGDMESVSIHYNFATGYEHRYILQRSLQLRHAKIKAEINRITGSIDTNE